MSFTMRIIFTQLEKMVLAPPDINSLWSNMIVTYFWGSAVVVRYTLTWWSYIFVVNVTETTVRTPPTYSIPPASHCPLADTHLIDRVLESTQHPYVDASNDAMLSYSASSHVFKTWLWWQLKLSTTTRGNRIILEFNVALLLKWIEGNINTYKCICLSLLYLPEILC